eukprot:6623853-Pyramimonas_sp.AAC.1
MLSKLRFAPQSIGTMFGGQKQTIPRVAALGEGVLRGSRGGLEGVCAFTGFPSPYHRLDYPGIVSKEDVFEPRSTYRLPCNDAVSPPTVTQASPTTGGLEGVLRGS